MSNKMINLTENDNTLTKYPTLDTTDNKGLDMYVQRQPKSPDRWVHWQPTSVEAQV